MADLWNSRANISVALHYVRSDPTFSFTDFPADFYSDPSQWVELTPPYLATGERHVSATPRLARLRRTAHCDIAPSRRRVAASAGVD